MLNVLELTKELIRIPSITPDDQNCQMILIEKLKALGFTIQILNSGKVSNFWAQHGTAKPLLVFAGHTDVVEAGNRDQWFSDPFIPEVRHGILYGRGAADMKSSLAAMIVASQQFLHETPNHQGSIGFLITSGEEGNDFLDGTPKVMEWLKKQNIDIDYCIVGEPSCREKIGDTIKIGRRGSLTGRLTIYGKQGHVAYPYLAVNPIHQSLLILHELAHKEWDLGNSYFPPTTFQISNIHAGNGAGNVIPGTLEILFNFRFSTETTYELLKQQVTHLFQQAGLHFTIDWMLNGEPFLTKPDALIEKTQEAIQQITGLQAELSTSGGTSDGRFIAPSGAQVIELGVCNATIHQVNECVAVDDLETLVKIYRQIMNELLP